MMDMAGAAEIPATKLFGRSPQGMNSTGEADLRNNYDLIAQMQERMLRPALEKLLPVMAISCWGFRCVIADAAVFGGTVVGKGVRGVFVDLLAEVKEFVVVFSVHLKNLSFSGV